jgi:Fe-S-cluster containining protein
MTWWIQRYKLIGSFFTFLLLRMTVSTYCGDVCGQIVTIVVSGRPLTKDDIEIIARKMGYLSKAEFIGSETRISSWAEQESLGNVITTLTMLSLKGNSKESEEQDGVPLHCRFLDESGYCGIHPEKPGVCWLYPFASWIELTNQKAVIHATFQLTGDCPGFYASRSLDSTKPVLKEYSEKIYNYNMAVSRTTRENYCSISIVGLQKT